MIRIQRKNPGSMWLRAMLRYWCDEYGCRMEKVDANTYRAVGKFRKEAEWHWERGLADINVRIINALRKEPEKNQRTLTAAVTRDYVKGLFTNVQRGSK